MLVGWWVLVGGAVVGLGEVGSGGIAANAAAAGLGLILATFWQSNTAKRGLERALVHRAMRSTRDSERGEVGVLM